MHGVPMSGRMSGRKLRRRFRAIRFGLLVGIVILSLGAITAASDYWRDRAIVTIRQQATETLSVQTEVLAGMFEKYRVLPPLLARQNDIASLFRAGGHPAMAAFKAEEAAGLSGARDVAFFWPDGRLLASARHIFDHSDAGLNQLFGAALQGRLGRTVISPDNNTRAYAFAAAVRRGGETLGLVTVYVDFERIEATWSLLTSPIYISDRNGTILIANRPEWRLKSVEAVSNETSGTMIYRLGREAVSHLDMVRDLPLLDWRLHVLGDMRPVEAAGLWGAALAAMACLVCAMMIFFWIMRRERTILQLRRDRATALRLERTVRDRTRALSVTNRELSREIDERRATEDKLKKTQAELVQTGKLAVIGQMSAALSHELNQPLAALKTYADNTHRMIAAGKLEQATANLGRIGAMVDRMAELSSTLLSFSRKPGTTISAVNLGSVVDEALILVKPRARKAGVMLTVDPKLRDYTVMGGRVRLSQVIVNLISNSIDALSGQKDSRITVTAGSEDGFATVVVADNGPGIPEELRASVFDPFFTTKQAGEGVGMGLSIAYNIVHDFGGRIELQESANGGCAFAVHLVAADQQQKAAE
jgi:two-component system, NtrC family, C4-dicarboxylate transport sensor histidine kinase DctB